MLRSSTLALLSALVVPMTFAAAVRAPQDPRPDDAAILSLLVRVGTVEIECTSYSFEHATLPEAKQLAESKGESSAEPKQESKPS